MEGRFRLRLRAAGLGPSWILLGIAIVTVLVYLPGLHGDFIFDDFPNLINNAALQVTSFSMADFWAAAWSSEAGTLRRPVSMVTFALNHYFSGWAPFPYKATNLLIHVVCGIALAGLSRELLQKFRAVRQPSLSDTAVRWIPIIVAALWLVHPLNLTSVLYVVQRMTSLSALFSVLALIAFLRCRWSLYNGQRNYFAALGALVACTLLAVFSKENGALIPIFALLIELAIFRGRTANGQWDKRVLGAFTAILGVPTAMVLALLFMHPDYLSNAYAGRPFTLSERLLTESRVIFFYLQSIVLPRVSELGLYHDDFIRSTSLFSPATTLPAIFGVAGLIGTGIYLLARRPLIGFAVLWFFAGHSLESSVIPLELVYEHRNYLPSYGVLFAFTYAAFRLAERLQLGGSSGVIAVVGVLTLAGVTFVRAQHWENNVTQALTEAANHPNSARAVYGAGRIYANLYLTGGLDSPEKAFETLENARALDQESILPSAALIMLAAKTGGEIRPAWVRSIVDRLQSTPPTPTTIATLKTIVSDKATVRSLGRDDVQRILDAALVSPKTFGGKRADLLTIYGSYWVDSAGNLEAAREMFMEAVRVSPEQPRYRLNLAQLLIVTGDLDAARSALTSAAELDVLGTHDDEISDLRRALIEPNPSS